MRYALFCAEDINLGLGYISTYLKSQGHEVRLFFDPLQYRRGYARVPLLSNLLSVEDYNIRQCVKYNPDVALFSSVTATYGWALGVAQKLKSRLPRCRIVFGGVHPSLVPEEVKKHDFIDDVCVGDGIEYFGGTFDPDHFWADREIFFKELPPEHRRTQLFMTSFGCPFNCSFCGNEQLRKIKKHKLFRRTVEGCIDELKHIKDTWGAKYILFVDDIFTTDLNWLKDFAVAYRTEIGLPFACFGHTKFLSDEVVRLLKTMGCHTIWLGIQSGEEHLRKTILNRTETQVEIIEACKRVKANGIKLMVDHIFGIPFESNIAQDISITLYNTIKPDIVNCYELLYFPKSRIIEHALKCGYLSFTDVQKIERGEGVVYQLGNTGHFYYDTFAKAMITIPLGSIIWELLPEWLIKLIVHIKAGRAFIIRVIIENEIFFTWRCVLKKLGVYRWNG